MSQDMINFSKNLSLMMEDVHKAPELFQPTSFWRNGIPPILEDIKAHGIQSFLTHQSALNMYVPHYAQRNYLNNKAQYQTALANLAQADKELARLWAAFIDGSREASRDYDIFMAADPDKAPLLSQVSENHGLPAPESFSFDNRRYSCGMLRYLKCLAFLKKMVPTEDIESVLEIGGGYGSLGEIFLKSPSKDYFYVNIDIPPTAAISTFYLQTLFGKDKVADYQTTREWDEISLADLREQGFRAAIFCPWQLQRVNGEFQLFVNTSSFQEMEPSVVGNYIELLKPLVKGSFLVRNSKYGKPMADHENSPGVEKPIQSQDYLDFLKHLQFIAKDSKFFGQIFSTGFESEVMIFQSEN